MKKEEKAPKNYFGLIMFFLKVSGIAIDEIENPVEWFMFNVFSFSILSTCVYYYVVAQGIDLFLHLDDFEYVSFSLCYMVTQTTGIIKGTLLLVNSKSISKYCKKLESDLFLPNLDRGGTNEYKFINRAVRFHNIELFFFYFFVFAIVGNRAVYALVSKAVVEVYDEATNSTITTSEKILPYNMYLPFDTKKHYYWAFTYQVFSCTYFGIYVGAIDALITGIMIHVKAQILILKNSLDYITERSYKMHEAAVMREVPRNPVNSVEKVPPEVQHYTTLIINDVIKHHEDIIKLVEETEDQFNVVMLAQFLGSLMLMCLQLFQLSLYDVNSPKFFSMGSYLVLMLFQLLIYCWNGNELTVESLDVARAAFECNWVHYDNDSQKAMVLMIQRAQRPLRLSAGKFAFLSLETYTTILRGSGSYYLALRKVNE